VGTDPALGALPGGSRSAYRAIDVTDKGFTLRRISRPGAIAAISLLVSVLLIGSCTSSDAKREAVSLSNTIHYQYNARQFGQIYTAANSMLKRTGTSDQFTGFMAKEQDRLGPFVSGTPSRWTEIHALSGHYIVLTMQSKFQKASAVEVFSFVRSGSGLSLSSYTVQSPALNNP
jgi:hypothetical protein